MLATFFFADFFLETFFLETFFLAACFLVTFFVLLSFFFLEAGFFRATFFREAFFRETFFRPPVFLPAFFLATTFFLDDFFADAFFLRAGCFLAADFFRLTDLAGAAFFLVARAFVRFLVADFLAVISIFLPIRKARNYTPVISTWKGLDDAFFEALSAPFGVLDRASQSVGQQWLHCRSGEALPGAKSGSGRSLEPVTLAALSHRSLFPGASFYCLNYITLPRVFQAMGT